MKKIVVSGQDHVSITIDTTTSKSDKKYPWKFVDSTLDKDVLVRDDWNEVTFEKSNWWKRF